MPRSVAMRLNCGPGHERAAMRSVNAGRRRLDERSAARRPKSSTSGRRDLRPDRGQQLPPRSATWRRARTALKLSLARSAAWSCRWRARTAASRSSPIILSLTPLRRDRQRLLHDLRQLLTRRSALTPSRSRRSTWARRGLHNEGSETAACDRLAGKIEHRFRHGPAAVHAGLRAALARMNCQARRLPSRPRAASVCSCGMNAIRSPMAERLVQARCFRANDLSSHSAGVRCRATADPVRRCGAMAEDGIDVGRARRRRTLDDLDDGYFDLIVTLAPEAHHRALAADPRRMPSTSNTGRPPIPPLVAGHARTGDGRLPRQCAMRLEGADQGRAFRRRSRETARFSLFTNGPTHIGSAQFRTAPERLSPPQDKDECRRKKSSSSRAWSPNCCPMRCSA